MTDVMGVGAAAPSGPIESIGGHSVVLSVLSGPSGGMSGLVGDGLGNSGAGVYQTTDSGENYGEPHGDIDEDAGAAGDAGGGRGRGGGRFGARGSGRGYYSSNYAGGRGPPPDRRGHGREDRRDGRDERGYSVREAVIERRAIPPPVPRPVVSAHGSLPRLRVSTETDPARTAGAIAHHAREWHACLLDAVGPTAVAKALDSIAMARRFIDESGADLMVRVTVGQEGEIARMVSFNCRPVAVHLDRGRRVRIHVGNEAQFSATATFLYHRAREGTTRCTLQARVPSSDGNVPLAISNMVMVLAKATEYFDADGRELFAQPHRSADGIVSLHCFVQ
eukprot:TRINITY_DN561_c0_g2_i1.p1 TRINITY_DN561_c0_g2~~TRINITY_DN561_c0_g2_i1.p1  ORF type:complete len:335 (+),score=40.98 TRINITY_DN561_c0_g2_i1:118-1122(+)